MKDETPYAVLLVDDIAGIRHLTRLALEEGNRFVVRGEADSGQSAVLEAERLQPDLVLLDLSMPGMTGLDVLPLLRAAAPGAAIVVHSGFGSPHTPRATQRLGAMGFVEKGVPPHVLRDRLLDILEGRASAVPS